MGNKVAAALLPHVSTAASAAAALLEIAGDCTSDLHTIKVDLPAGTALAIKNGPVAQAIAAAGAISDPADFAVMAKESRVTVLRVLASNKKLPHDVASRLARQAFKRTDRELLHAVMWRLPAAEILALRDEFSKTVFDARLFASQVLSRESVEDTLALLADKNGDLAGYALAACASGKIPGLDFTAGFEALEHDHRHAIQLAVSKTTHMDAAFATAIRLYGVPFASNHSHVMQAVQFAPGAIAALLAEGAEPVELLRVLRADITDEDVDCVISKGVVSAFAPGQKPFSAADTIIHAFASDLGRRCSSEVRRAGIDCLIDAVTAQPPRVSTSYIDKHLRLLLCLASDDQRASLLSACSISALGLWLRTQDTTVVFDEDTTFDVTASLPRPGEAVQAIRARPGEAEQLLHAMAFGWDGMHGTNGEPPAWWSDAIDAFEGEFMTHATRYTNHMAFAARRLEESCRNVPERWQFVVSSWPGWHGSLSDLCMLAKMTAPGDDEEELSAPLLDLVGEQLSLL